MTNPWHYFRTGLSAIATWATAGYRRLKRFIAWFPVLWKDEDWDEAYLFEIMRFKISRMRKNVEENKISVDYQKTARDMKIAEELLARVASGDFYFDLARQIEAREKLGKCLCPEETFCFEPGDYDKKGKLLTSRLVDLSCDYCKDARLRWYKDEEAKKREDFDYLFRHLKKHVHTWWD